MIYDQFDKKNVAKENLGSENKTRSPDKYSELMKRQWGDTTEKRTEYQAEHRKDIDKIVEKREQELAAEDKALQKEEKE